MSIPNCEKKSSVDAGLALQREVAAGRVEVIVVGDVAGFFISGLIGVFVAPPLGLLGLLRLMPLAFLLPDEPLLELTIEPLPEALWVEQGIMYQSQGGQDRYFDQQVRGLLAGSAPV